RRHQRTMTSIPTSKNATFPESSFFKTHPTLPSPSEVRTQSLLTPGPKPSIAIFSAMKLVVKFGNCAYASIAEGQCMYMIARTFGKTVPVPEIFGWKTDGNETFVYMKLVKGVTLEKAWDSLSCAQRTGICRELRGMLDTLRGLEQEDRGQRGYVGHIDYGPLTDIALPMKAQPAGPFPSVHAFHDWFSGLCKRHLDDPSGIPDPFRAGLPNDAPIKFTHGDLHRSNILVSVETDEPHVVCLIDWHQAGWLPAYWEVHKAIYTADYKSEWVRKYVPMFLDPWESTFESWDFYVGACGN
ncbi:kinase-like domain-containing protein, partial [Delphinella strobiligena]